MLDLVNPGHRHEVLVAAVTSVVVVAALYRRVRSRTLSAARAAEGVRSLRQDLARTYRIVEMDSGVVEAAIAMAERHALRGYDCVQLATVLAAAELRRAQSLAAMTLVSADVELIEAALAESVAVENPNSHREPGEP